MDLLDAFIAPSTNQSSTAGQSSDARTAQFGTDDSGAEAGEGILLALPAVATATQADRGRKEKKEKSSRYSSSRSTPIYVETTSTKKSGRSDKTKSPRSARSSGSRLSPADLLVDDAFEHTSTRRSGRSDKTKSPRSARSVSNRVSTADLMLDEALRQHQLEKDGQRAEERAGSAPAHPVATHDVSFTPEDWIEALRLAESSSSSGQQVLIDLDYMADVNEDFLASKRQKPDCLACRNAECQINSDQAVIAGLRTELSATHQQLVLASEQSRPIEQMLKQREFELRCLNERGAQQMAELESVAEQQGRQVNKLSEELRLNSSELRALSRVNENLKTEKDQYAERAAEQQKALDILARDHSQKTHPDTAFELAEMNHVFGEFQKKLSERTLELGKSIDHIGALEGSIQMLRQENERLERERGASAEEVAGLRKVDEVNRHRDEVNKHRISYLESAIDGAKSENSSTHEQALALAKRAATEIAQAQADRDTALSLHHELQQQHTAAAERLDQMATEFSAQNMISLSEITRLKDDNVRLREVLAKQRENDLGGAASAAGGSSSYVPAPGYPIGLSRKKLQASYLEATASAAGGSSGSAPTPGDPVGLSRETTDPATATASTPVRSISPGGKEAIIDMISKFQSEVSRSMASISNRMNQFEQSRSRGRSSTRDSRSESRRRTLRVQLPEGPPDPGDDGRDSPPSSSGGDDEGPVNRDEEGLQDGDGVPVIITTGTGAVEGSTVTETRRFREQDNVKVPNFPTVPTLNAWKIQVGKNLVTASGRFDQQELKWWGEINDPSATFESLYDSGADRFKSLDLKLSAALGVMLKQAKNQVSEQAAFKEAEYFDKGEMPKGRQLAWLILQHFKTNPKMGVLYNVTDIGKVAWRGDTPKQIHSFMMIWQYVLRNIKTKIPQDELAEILLTKLEKSTALKNDIDAYNRMEEDDPKRNYDYLMNSMERFLTRARYTANRELDMISIIGSELGGRNAVPASLDTGDVADPKKTKKPRAKSVPAKAGKGGGKGEVTVKQICFYFNQPGGCNKSAKDCKFAHTKLSAEDLAKLKKPGAKIGGKGEPRAPSPAGKGDKAKPKAEAKAKAKASGPSFCFKFTSEKGCPDANCKFMHLDNASVAEFKRTQKLLADAAKKKT